MQVTMLIGSMIALVEYVNELNNANSTKFKIKKSCYSCFNVRQIFTIDLGFLFLSTIVQP